MRTEFEMLLAERELAADRLARALVRRLQQGGAIYDVLDVNLERWIAADEAVSAYLDRRVREDKARRTGAVPGVE